MKMSPLVFKDYTTVPREVKIQNWHGHTFHVVFFEFPDPPSQPMVYGLDLDHFRYRLEQAHFHWGENSSVGSEHFIDGKQYPLELHFVHYNTEYRNIKNAVEDGKKCGDNTILVVGVLFEISEKDNENLEPLITGLKKIIKVNSSTSLKGNFTPRMMLSESINKFYKYNGSFTTDPPCTEIVTWIVQKEINKISEKQLAHFRNLDENVLGQKLVHNYRPIQKLNDREIYEVSGKLYSDSGASSVMNKKTAGATLGLLAILVFFLQRGVVNGGSFHNDI